MFHLFINPSTYRKWKIECENENGRVGYVVYAFTFQDALHDWWQGEETSFPTDIPIELGNCLSGLLTFYIENDIITIQDITSDDDPNLISCSDLVERRRESRKQERLARKARNK